MVLLLAKNSKAGCLFRSNFLKQAVIEIQKMEHPVKNFQSIPLPGLAIELSSSKLVLGRNVVYPDRIFHHYTRISFYYEYASAVMMGLICLGVKQPDAIKHI